MKRILSIIAISAIILTSCMPTNMLQGSYQDTPYTREATLTYEEAWSRVIDFFANNGVPITTIDKSSGLIVASRTSFIHSCTVEVDGKLENPNAYVVTPLLRGAYGMGRAKLIKLTGDWNVRIKVQDGKTLVTINLLNIECQYQVGDSIESPMAASTGNFERMLFRYIAQ